MTTSSRSTLLVQDVGEDQRRDDRGVGLDDEAGGVYGELAPGDLLVRYGAAVGAVGRGAVGDLAEVAPEPAVLVQVLLNQRHDADREVARDAATDLEKADRRINRVVLVPLHQVAHELQARLHAAVFDIPAQ